MTQTGNLARAVVAEMADRMTWSGFDKEEMFRYCKVVNEPDFFPLFVLRHVVEAAKLIRRYKGHFMASPAARKLSHEPSVRASQAVLFHTTFWLVDLGYLTWSPYVGWPRRDAGIILWSLSVAAHDWQPPEQLTRLCSVPTNELFA
jgi:hypothetical protein